MCHGVAMACGADLSQACNKIAINMKIFGDKSKTAPKLSKQSDQLFFSYSHQLQPALQAITTLAVSGHSQSKCSWPEDTNWFNVDRRKRSFTLSVLIWVSSGLAQSSGTCSCIEHPSFCLSTVMLLLQRSFLNCRLCSCTSTFYALLTCLWKEIGFSLSASWQNHYEKLKCRWTEN